MKLFKKIIIFSGILLLINACSLNEKPYGFLSTANYYKTAGDANSAIIDCYSNLGETGLYSRMLFYVSSYGSGEFDTKSDGGAGPIQLVTWTTDPSNQILQQIFAESYLNISRDNGVINNVPSIVMDTTQRNQIVGEAYFLRALMYFNLVRLFGSVPIHTTVVSSTNQIATPKSSIEEVYNLIIADLKKAEIMMTNTYTDGRANQIAAQALLSKVYLTMASSKASGAAGYSWVSNADTYYADASAEANKVLTKQTTYTFWTGDLRQLWSIKNEKKNEFIFSIGMDKSGSSEGQYSKAPKNWTPYINGGLITLGPNFADGAQTVDGWNQCITNSYWYSQWDPSDKRREGYMCAEVKTPDGTEYSYTANPGVMYPFPIKWTDTTATSDPSGHYLPVLRYSDVLLVYAEAQGPTAEGYAAVNKIRERAGLADLPSGLSVADFRTAVVKERSFELCFEYNRLFDLRRTNTVKSVLEGAGYGKTIDNHADFYDIPLIETENNPALNQ